MERNEKEKLFLHARTQYISLNVNAQKVNGLSSSSHLISKQNFIYDNKLELFSMETDMLRSEI